jgi:hypothetical protein
MRTELVVDLFAAFSDECEDSGFAAKFDDLPVLDNYRNPIGAACPLLARIAMAEMGVNVILDCESHGATGTSAGKQYLVLLDAKSIDSISDWAGR